MYDSICAKAKSPDKTVCFSSYVWVCAGHLEEDSSGKREGPAQEPHSGSQMAVGRVSPRLPSMCCGCNLTNG